MCSNGWCALALGDDIAKWGVGWGEDREAAERFARQNANERIRRAKVVYKAVPPCLTPVGQETAIPVF